MKRRIILTVCCVALLTTGFEGCSSRRTQNSSNESQDQRTREEVAQATEKAKEASKELADKADRAAKDLAHKAEIVKEGVKQGWNEGASQPLNLNSASEAELQNLPGIKREAAQKIILGRPYTSKNDLLSKGIVSKNEFQAIQSHITVK